MRDSSKDSGTRLISDIIFLTQRASGDTCEVVARTVERQTGRFLSKNPGMIKNASAFLLTSEKLCKCILSLKEAVSGTGEEIMVKRLALDLLLALSNEVDSYPVKLPIDVPVEKYAQAN